MLNLLIFCLQPKFSLWSCSGRDSEATSLIGFAQLGATGAHAARGCEAHRQSGPELVPGPASSGRVCERTGGSQSLGVQGHRIRWAWWRCLTLYQSAPLGSGLALWGGACVSHWAFDKALNPAGGEGCGPAGYASAGCPGPR